MSDLPAAAWFPDPTNALQERWWNGQAWADDVRPLAPTMAPPAPVSSPAQDPTVPLFECTGEVSDGRIKVGTVTVYADRIETATKKVAMNKRHAAGAVLPLRSVSSVSQERDGIAFQKVTFHASGGGLSVKVKHQDAGELVAVVNRLMLAR